MRMGTRGPLSVYGYWGGAGLGGAAAAVAPWQISVSRNIADHEAVFTEQPNTVRGALTDRARKMWVVCFVRFGFGGISLIW